MKLYDKRDFPIQNFPFICNNIPASPACGVGHPLHVENIYVLINLPLCCFCFTTGIFYALCLVFKVYQLYHVWKVDAYRTHTHTHTQQKRKKEKLVALESNSVSYVLQCSLEFILY
jgi:predicted histidine transporter YuiF (NhaC family)